MPRNITREFHFVRAKTLVLLVTCLASQSQGEDESADAGATPSVLVKSLDAAKQHLERFQELHGEISSLRGEIGRERDAATRKDLGTKLHSLESEHRQQVAAAIAAYESAIDAATTMDGTAHVAGDEMPLDLARYFLCYCYYTAKKFDQCAALGEWTVRNRPDSKYSINLASMAMAAHTQLYYFGKDKAKARQRIVDFGGFLWESREDENAAALVFDVLTNKFLLLDEPLSSKELLLLTDVTKTSLDKPLNERFSVGARAFRAWLAEVAATEPIEVEPDDVAGSESQNQLTSLRAQAEELLESADAELAKEMRNILRRRFLEQSHVAGVLALSRLRFMDGNVKASQALLEHRVYGPLTLLKADHKVIHGAFDPNLERDILEHAVRLYRRTNQSDLAAPLEKQLAVVIKRGPLLPDVISSETAPR